MYSMPNPSHNGLSPVGVVARPEAELYNILTEG
jgi:hypothetical protein